VSVLCWEASCFGVFCGDASGNLSFTAASKEDKSLSSKLLSAARLSRDSASAMIHAEGSNIVQVCVVVFGVVAAR
jgi:hypothetical protein